jgi:hypothetical protein
MRRNRNRRRPPANRTPACPCGALSEHKGAPCSKCGRRLRWMKRANSMRREQTKQINRPTNSSDRW